MILACQAGGSGESSRWLRRARQVVLACLAGGSGELSSWFQPVRQVRVRDRVRVTVRVRV